jgi:hypothetical protein
MMMTLTPRSVAFNLGIVAAWGMVAMLSNVPPPPPPMLPPPMQTLVVEELFDEDEDDEDPAFFYNRNATRAITHGTPAPTRVRFGPKKCVGTTEENGPHAPQI